MSKRESYREGNELEDPLFWPYGMPSNDQVPNKMRLWFIEAHDELGIPLPEGSVGRESVFELPCQMSHALFSKRFYQNPIVTTRVEKDLDFVFIGSFTMMIEMQKAMKNRRWVIRFAKDYFNDKSIFCNTTGNLNLIQSALRQHPPWGHPRTGKPYHGIHNDPLLGLNQETGEIGWRDLGPWDITFKEHDHWGTLKSAPRTSNKGQQNAFDEAYFQKMTRAKFAVCPGGDAPWSMRFYEALMCRAIPIISWDRESYRSPAESIIDYKYYLAHEGPFVYRKDWAAHNYEIFLRNHTLYYK